MWTLILGLLVCPDGLFSQEIESFTCVTKQSYKFIGCLLENITITKKFPNYIETDEVKEKFNEMNFKNGKMNTLPDQLFFNYNNIVIMTILNCGLTEITQESFKSAKMLKYLMITENQIVNLNSKIFNECTGLFLLDLSWNLIEFISSDVFQSLVNLDTIHLNNNRIKIIEENTLSNIYLRFLYLTDNQIEEFNQINFNISNIYIEKNLLSSLNINKNYYALYAESNKISKIIVDEKNILLKHLSLTDNNLTDLRNISKLTELNSLELNDNNIQITPGTFTGLSQLHSLDIRRNNRTIEDLRFLKPLKGLETLRIEQSAIFNFNVEHILEIVPKVNVWISQPQGGYS